MLHAAIIRVKQCRLLLAYLWIPTSKPTKCYEDNGSVVHTVTSDLFTPRLRHIDIPIFFLYHDYGNNFFEVKPVPSRIQFLIWARSQNQSLISFDHRLLLWTMCMSIIVLQNIINICVPLLLLVTTSTFKGNNQLIVLNRLCSFTLIWPVLTLFTRRKIMHVLCYVM